MDKRFDMLMWFIGILTVVGTATSGYLISRIGKQDERMAQTEMRNQHIDISRLLHDLRDADPAIRKALREVLKS